MSVVPSRGVSHDAGKRASRAGAVWPCSPGIESGTLWGVDALLPVFMRREEAAEERARIHRAEGEEATRLLASADDTVERERLKRLADRHAASALLHERAARFQAEAIARLSVAGGSDQHP